MLKKTVAIVLVAVSVGAVAAAFAGTNPRSASPQGAAAPTYVQRSAAKKRYTIYFATFAIANSFWAPMRRGALDAGAQTGNKVVWTQGTEFSTPETVKRMQVALAARPDAMVVTDIVPSAFEPIMRKAQQRGIVVINANAPSPNKNPPYLFYVGANEYLAGQEAARRTLAAGEPKRAVCEIQVLESVALNDRCKGYKSVLSRAGVKVDILDVSGTPTEAQAKMQSYFATRRDATAAYLLTADPAYLTPMLQVKKKAGRKIIFVTNDTSANVFDAIGRGEVLGTIGQQQYLQGYMPVIIADLYLRYGFLPASKEFLTGPFFINKVNVKRIRSLVQQGIQ